MPHLTLEYTDNITQAVDSRRFFSTLHQILAGVVGIEADNCKSRSLCLDTHHVGRGNEDQAFVHLTIRLLSGRPLELRREIARQALGLLEETYDASLDALDLQITVEVAEMQPETYFKAPGAGHGERRHNVRTTRL